MTDNTGYIRFDNDIKFSKELKRYGIQLVSDAFSSKGLWEGVDVKFIPEIITDWCANGYLIKAELFMLGVESSFFVPLDNITLVIEKPNIKFADTMLYNDTIAAVNHILSKGLDYHMDDIYIWEYTNGIEYVEDLINLFEDNDKRFYDNIVVVPFSDIL